MERLNIKLNELISVLKNNGNKAHEFFESIQQKLHSNKIEAMDLLLTSGAITQYANFSAKEDQLFAEVWDLAKSCRNDLT